MYLSVDLDYWLNSKTTKSANVFFRKLFKLNKPMVIVQDHDKLVPDINKYPPQDKIIYNVDFHSDIVGERDLQGRRCSRKEALNCGNWVNYVNFRKEGIFYWIYPSAKTCYLRRESTRVPFDNSDYSGWKKIYHRQGLHNVPLNKVERIGISVSPDYYNIDPIFDVLEALYKYPFTEETKRMNKKRALDDLMWQFKDYEVREKTLPMKRIKQLAKKF